MFSLNKDRELIINIHVAYHIKFPDKVYNFALNEADFISGVGMLHLFLEILQLILTAYVGKEEGLREGYKRDCDPKWPILIEERLSEYPWPYP